MIYVIKIWQDSVVKEAPCTWVYAWSFPPFGFGKLVPHGGYMRPSLRGLKKVCVERQTTRVDYFDYK